MLLTCTFMPNRDWGRKVAQGKSVPHVGKTECLVQALDQQYHLYGGTRNKGEDEEAIKPLLELTATLHERPVRVIQLAHPRPCPRPASIPYYPASSSSLGPETSGNDPWGQ